MPDKVVKRGGSRPYKIVEKATGKVKGSSTSRAKAESALRARAAGKHNPNWKRRGR